MLSDDEKLIRDDNRQKKTASSPFPFSYRADRIPIAGAAVTRQYLDTSFIINDSSISIICPTPAGILSLIGFCMSLAEHSSYKKLYQSIMVRFDTTSTVAVVDIDIPTNQQYTVDKNPPVIDGLGVSSSFSIHILGQGISIDIHPGCLPLPLDSWLRGKIYIL